MLALMLPAIAVRAVMEGDAVASFDSRQRRQFVAHAGSDQQLARDVLASALGHDAEARWHVVLAWSLQWSGIDHRIVDPTDVVAAQFGTSIGEQPARVAAIATDEAVEHLGSFVSRSSAINNDHASASSPEDECSVEPGRSPANDQGIEHCR